MESLGLVIDAAVGGSIGATQRGGVPSKHPPQHRRHHHVHRKVAAHLHTTTCHSLCSLVWLRSTDVLRGKDLCIRSVRKRIVFIKGGQQLSREFSTVFTGHRLAPGKSDQHSVSRALRRATGRSLNMPKLQQADLLNESRIRVRICIQKTTSVQMLQDGTTNSDSQGETWGAI